MDPLDQCFPFLQLVPVALAFLLDQVFQYLLSIQQIQVVQVCPEDQAVLEIQAILFLQDLLFVLVNHPSPEFQGRLKNI